LCIKLVLIKELYYDARPNKSQDLQSGFGSDRVAFPQHIVKNRGAYPLGY